MNRCDVDSMSLLCFNSYHLKQTEIEIRTGVTYLNDWLCSGHVARTTDFEVATSHELSVHRLLGKQCCFWYLVL